MSTFPEPGGQWGASDVRLNLTKEAKSNEHGQGLIKLANRRIRALCALSGVRSSS